MSGGWKRQKQLEDVRWMEGLELAFMRWSDQT
jgi:hypothetical protein